MAIISDPFVANVTKQLTPENLIQAIRADIVGEYEAVMGYEAHALTAPNERVRQILQQIADDEKKHIGQLMEVLDLLSPQDQQLLAQGRQTAQQAIQGIQPQANAQQ